MENDTYTDRTAEKLDLAGALEKIRARRKVAGKPRSERDEMLELFQAKLNAGNIADGYPKVSIVRVAKMLEGLPTADLHAIYKKCETYRKFGAGLKYELKPRV